MTIQRRSVNGPGFFSDSICFSNPDWSLIRGPILLQFSFVFSASSVLKVLPA